ncbi:unnamed protein product [Closterium sp. Yama58-4]|nr:unnamed protein product [Closterium sp. Yama58-4]
MRLAVHFSSPTLLPATAATASGIPSGGAGAVPNAAGGGVSSVQGTAGAFGAGLSWGGAAADTPVAGRNGFTSSGSMSGNSGSTHPVPHASNPPTPPSHATHSPSPTISAPPPHSTAHVRITAIDFGIVSVEEYPTGLVHLSGQYLEQVASMLGLSLTFHGIETTPQDFHPSQVEVDEGEEVVVLANWSLMIFPDDTVLRSNPRNSILKWIRDLRPLLVLQFDIDLDANGPFFLSRFHAAFMNFAALLESFDCSLPHAATPRFVAETILARDFVNEVACEGMNRWLRAERLGMWVHRMRAVGLEPVPLGPDTLAAGREITEGRDKRFRLEVHGKGNGKGKGSVARLWKTKQVLSNQGSVFCSVSRPMTENDKTSKPQPILQLCLGKAPLTNEPALDVVPTTSNGQAFVLNANAWCSGSCKEIGSNSGGSNSAASNLDTFLSELDAPSTWLRDPSRDAERGSEQVFPATSASVLRALQPDGSASQVLTFEEASEGLFAAVAPATFQSARGRWEQVQREQAQRAQLLLPEQEEAPNQLLTPQQQTQQQGQYQDQQQQQQQQQQEALHPSIPASTRPLSSAIHARPSPPQRSSPDQRPSPYRGGDIGVGAIRGPPVDPNSAPPPSKLPRRPPDLSSRLAAVLQNINPSRPAPSPWQLVPCLSKPGLPSAATPAAPAATASISAAQSFPVPGSSTAAAIPTAPAAAAPAAAPPAASAVAAAALAVAVACTVSSLKAPESRFVVGRSRGDTEAFMGSKLFPSAVRTSNGYNQRGQWPAAVSDKTAVRKIRVTAAHSASDDEDDLCAASRTFVAATNIPAFGPERPLRVDVSGMLPRPMCGAREGMLKQQLMALAEAMAVDDSVRGAVRDGGILVEWDALSMIRCVERWGFGGMDGWGVEGCLYGESVRRRRLHIIAIGLYCGPHWIEIFMGLAAQFSSPPLLPATTATAATANGHPPSGMPGAGAGAVPNGTGGGVSSVQGTAGALGAGSTGGGAAADAPVPHSNSFTSSGSSGSTHPTTPSPPLSHATTPSRPTAHVKITAVDFGFVSLEEYPTGLVHLGGQYLEQVASMMGLSLSFHGMETTPHDFHPSQVEVDEGEEVVVLANWGLMVFPDDTVLRSNPRNAILKWIRDLRPLLLLQVDIDLDANGPFFLSRFHAAFANFAALIESFDASMPHAALPRLVAETILARDFINEVACEGMDRWLRSERLDKWVHRMKAVGLEPVPLGPDTVAAGKAITECRDKRFRLEVHGHIAKLRKTALIKPGFFN